MAIRKHVREFLATAVVTVGLLAANSAQGQSAAECSARADRAARNSMGVAGGALTGSVGGAAFGAIVGGNRRSVGRGAALGAVVGGAAGAYNQNEAYKRVYDDCMRGR